MNLDNGNAAEIAGKLTEAQRKALLDAARYLDHAAGADIGLGEGMDTLWGCDVVMMLAEAFNIEWEHDFAEAVRALLGEAK